MAIDWRNSSGQHVIPCGDCYRLMCHVQEYCNVEISVCDKHNTKKPLDCPPAGANNTQQKAAYEKFKLGF